MLATLRFAVVTNIADDRGEFRHMRRIGRRHLTQRSARSDDVFYSLRASRQLPLAITQQRYTVSQAGLTLIYAMRRGRHQIAIFAHRRVVAVRVFYSRLVCRLCSGRNR
jgi:hypothetical protein